MIKEKVDNRDLHFLIVKFLKIKNASTFQGQMIGIRQQVLRFYKCYCFVQTC